MFRLFRSTMLLFCGICYFTTLSGQCPERDFLWNRIWELRASDATPKAQLDELLPYLEKMSTCPYRNDSTHVLLLQRIGWLQCVQNEYTTGILNTKKAVEIVYANINSKKINPGQLVKIYNNLRIFYDSLNMEKEMNEVIDSNIATVIRYKTGHETIGKPVFDRARSFFEQGDYYTSIRYATLAMQIADEAGYTLEARLNTMTWWMNSLFFLKKFDEAEKLLGDKVNDWHESASTKLIGSMYELYARIILRKGDLAKALSCFRKAFIHSERIKYPEGCASALNNAGYLVYFMKLQDYGMALQYYYKALNYADESESLNIYDNIANLYAKRGMYDSALFFFQKAFDQLGPGINEHDVSQHMQKYARSTVLEYISNLMLDKAETLLAYYKATKNKEKLNEALRSYKAIDGFLDKARVGHAEAQTRLFWRSHTHRLYENAIEVCYLQNNTTDAFYFFEKSRASLLNEQMNQRKWLAKEDIQRLSAIERSIADSMSELALTGQSSQRYADLQKSIFYSKQALNEVRQTIKEKNPLYFKSFIDSVFITPGDVRGQLLTSHQALVELFMGDSAMYMLTITVKNIAFRKIDKQQFSQLIDPFITSLSSPGLMNRNFVSFTNTSRALYQLLFYRSDLPKGRIIISPAGQYFPFEALVTSEPGQPLTYFVDNYAVSYTYSARYLLNKFSAGESASAKRFMGVAPVRYAGSMKLPSLFGSDKSLTRLQSYFGDGNRLVEGNASKNNFLQQFNQYGIIQLYTHASAGGDNSEPMIFFADSALLLSDLIYGARPFTRLIVLSACETAKGKLYQGEGVFSFNREFASMGIPASVSNLWQVDNESTYRLTELFYKYLAKEFPADIALQKAKTEFIHTANGETKLPYFWAAPVLIGQSDAIVYERQFPFVYFFSLLAWVIVVFWLYRGRLLKLRHKA